MIRVAFEEQSSGEIKMVAYPENHKTSSSSQTTKIENYSLKASTGKRIHHGESSITSKGVGKGERRRERERERESYASCDGEGPKGWEWEGCKVNTLKDTHTTDIKFVVY